MVLVQSSSPSLVSRIHPNPARIAGVSGAIVLNVIVLMLLMTPMKLPMQQLTKSTITVVDLLKKKDPPPKPEPVEVEITKPRVEQQPIQQRVEKPVPVADPAPQLASEQQVKIDSPRFAVNDSAPTAAVPDPAPGPVSGMRLEYASAPAPTYPRREMMAGRQGTVILRVLVDVDGSPLQVDVHTSSGNRNLDRAAREHVLTSWKFRPAMRNGQPVQAIGMVPIDFKLQ